MSPAQEWLDAHKFHGTVRDKVIENADLVCDLLTASLEDLEDALELSTWKPLAARRFLAAVEETRAARDAAVVAPARSVADAEADAAEAADEGHEPVDSAPADAPDGGMIGARVDAPCSVEDFPGLSGFSGSHGRLGRQAKAERRILVRF